MDIGEILFLIGNIICAVGTLDLIKSVVHNRQILHGYSLFGSSLTLIALVFLNLGFFYYKQFLSVFFGIITLSYWVCVVEFKLKYRGKQK